MATNPQQTGSMEILSDVLKVKLAPFANFQRDIQALTQGLRERFGCYFLPNCFKKLSSFSFISMLTAR